MNPLPNLILQMAALAQPGAAPGAGASGDAVQTGTSLLKFISGGGTIGYVIIALSIAAMALVVIHAVQIRRDALMPADKLNALKGMLAEGQAEEALEYCVLPANECYLTRILAAGLTRYLHSAFGAFELKNAIEEAGAEETSRLYRSTDAIGVIGGIAPLLGLLGTVYGMIGAFDTVASSASNNTAGYYEALATNISIALVTTFQGLVVAIPCVTIFTYFRNRIDSIASEAGQRLDELVMLMEGGSRPATPAGASPPAAPTRAPAGARP